MKYFLVTWDSIALSGFQTNFYVQAENEEALIETIERENWDEEMYDYVSGWMDESDYENMDEDDLIYTRTISEVPKEEFDFWVAFQGDSPNFG